MVETINSFSTILANINKSFSSFQLDLFGVILCWTSIVGKECETRIVNEFLIRAENWWVLKCVVQCGKNCIESQFQCVTYIHTYNMYHIEIEGGGHRYEKEAEKKSYWNSWHNQLKVCGILIQATTSLWQ
jgi:hypothetical protein